MLGLELREEFKGRRLKGTAIELSNKDKTGATDVGAQEFLSITYPTADLLKMIEAVGNRDGRPIVLKGERGQGKSHLMAALFHTLTNRPAASSWLADWSSRLNNEKIAEIDLRTGLFVISESLHRHRVKHLWDLLFQLHPHGEYCRGKWEAPGTGKTDVPSDELLIEMFKHTPTALVLDEFQTWFDGLAHTKQSPQKGWAFNFIQLLSEIAKAHPDLLVLVVSVRNGQTDAFQQLQRVSPIIVDFRGPSAKSDRQRLLLHRLFKNRAQVADDHIVKTIHNHVKEYLRLKNITGPDENRIRQAFVQAWPFAFHLMDLLEDQVLVATHAQETRDLIRILADLFKSSGGKDPIITAGSFRLDDQTSGVAALLDSFANEHHGKLREKALRNIESVRDAIHDSSERVPHLSEIVSALWLRSLVESNLGGADASTLQIDISRSAPLDDNAFSVELTTIVEHSFNIHEDGKRLIFREEENARAKLIASAKNDRLFTGGEDIVKLSKEIRYAIGGSVDIASRYQVVVLPQYWMSNPWKEIDESEHPKSWEDRIVILVLPESPEGIGSRLGEWLRNNLQSNRNAVRFLLARVDSENVFADRELVVLARAVYLAELWRNSNQEYSYLHTKYQKELREILNARFDRFAILSNWSFQKPENCRFHIETHKAEGQRIPEAIDKQITDNLFVPEEFEEFILEMAPNNVPVGSLLKELREPRANGQDCIPWLGEVQAKERMIRLCARGKIAINVRGLEYLQKKAEESEEDAWRRMRGKLGVGRHLDETYVLLPQEVPVSAGSRSLGSEIKEEPTQSGPQSTAISRPATGDVNGGAVSTSDLFSGSSSLTPLSTPATSALNLLGKVENWGINAGTQIHEMELKVSKLSGAQLQDLLRKLPDGMTYELGIKKEERNADSK